MKYTFIQEQPQHHTATALCSALNVSMSGYYDWVGRHLSSTARANQALVTKIRCYHKASRSTYGSSRIHKDLASDGERASRQRAERLMRSARIQSKMAKKFIITTNSKNTKSPAPDLLKCNFRTTGRNQAWVSDTRFIRTRQAWLYLAMMRDLYSRQVVGWAMSERNDTTLVVEPLMMAKLRRRRLNDVIVHSDQGSTYASGEYRKLLKENNMLCSMSRKGECYDNAVAESFFGTLKTELVDAEDHRTRAPENRACLSI